MKKYEIIGEVKCKWQESSFQSSGKHCYCSYLELPSFPTDYPEHFDMNDLRIWLKSMVDFESIEGKKIKITAEIVNE